ncbi:ABC transporter [Actinokineospora fastidiosa]|uniref:ABC transporter n=2 Tax=Actinokineospora fastidiosa TaxID=1816 RepID=A0A918LIZ8_9PSEU|nr:ABC transporter [Actinokineospora fastidiosa]
MKRMRTLAAALAVCLAAAGCGGSGRQSQDPGPAGGIAQDRTAIDPAATGPAPEVPGARRGGVITVYARTTPNTFDPTNIYYADANAMAKLIFRTPTQVMMRDGNPVLVPDLTDLGTVSDDKLTWTFRMRPGIKYADGSEVRVEDLAYAIKRSFAHDVFPYGPSYQLSYFRDGDTYKGPYASGDDYSGVETPDAQTLVIHLAKPFADLPFFMAFPLFTPIPKAKDTKETYGNDPMATGPYQFDAYTPGSRLTLKRNPHWDPASDPARHQYVDGWDFRWGQDDVKTQQQVLNSTGPDAAALNYAQVDASLLPQLAGDKAAQLVTGASPCTRTFQLDSRKIPLEVRKAVAKAWPADQMWRAEGLNGHIAQKATTILSPSVPGYTQYPPVPDLTSEGPGDPAAARKMLEDAGRLGFELSWYYDNTSAQAQQTSQIRADAFTAAGFTVKPIGITTAEVRAKTSDYDAPVNMGQSPQGWCSDWPTGGGWFPVLFTSEALANRQSLGMLTDPAVDAEIESIAALPAAEATAKWGELDRKLMEMYLVIPRFYMKTAFIVGTAVGGAAADSSLGQPTYTNLYVKSA